MKLNAPSERLLEWGYFLYFLPSTYPYHSNLSGQGKLCFASWNQSVKFHTLIKKCCFKKNPQTDVRDKLSTVTDLPYCRLLHCQAAAKGAPVRFLSKLVLLPFSHYYKPFNLDVSWCSLRWVCLIVKTGAWWTVSPWLSCKKLNCMWFKTQVHVYMHM